MRAFTTSAPLSIALTSVLVAALLAAGVMPAPAATGGTVVSATVPSATSVIASGCAAGLAGRTDLGLVAPGSLAVTSIDCSVAFGSSNDTAQLRLRQTDRTGVAMWMPTTGMLDPTYDGPTGTGNGQFIDPIGASLDLAFAAATQVDGKVVVAGRCHNGADLDFCLARYDSSTGALDPSFDGPGGGGNGKFLDPIGGGNDEALAVLVQPDGKIVAAGYCHNGANFDFCLARYHPDGSRDVTFDGPGGTGNGRFLDPVGSGNDYIRAALLHADGRITVVGYCSNGANNDFCLARYGADGALDASFDGPGGTGNGRFLDPIAAGRDEAVSAVLQPDGRIVAAGRCANGADDDFCLARYLGDGTRDPVFDGPSGAANGAFLEPIAAGNDAIQSIVLDPAGMLTAAGNCSNGSDDDFCLARYDAVGQRDVTFDGPGGGGNGEFLDPIGAADDAAFTTLIAPDGHVLAAGHCNNGVDRDFCVARYTDVGARDPSLTGPSGVASGAFFSPIGTGNDFARAAVELADGTTLLVGYCNVGADQDHCHMALDGGAIIDDYATGGGSDRDFASGTATSFFAACLRAVSGGATADWSIAGGCPAADGADWHAVPTASQRIAYTTALEPDPVDATAHLRFALRPSTTQRSGAYVAPLTFDVLAPAA